MAFWAAPLPARRSSCSRWFVEQPRKLRLLCGETTAFHVLYTIENDSHRWREGLLHGCQALPPFPSAWDLGGGGHVLRAVLGSRSHAAPVRSERTFVYFLT
ncbi:hypothetical protein IscW_ISCW014290 [Ixodes scapularis]|uniref:Uncharacterized protein n=1 Tax=Ixodes scapularis TaxID=6945 RepID=B7QIP5_IXOSC|nr:hypothetical protein IscW_ISCW014290 [Ixodes scapularis]|eukprot:XP_002415052.1 hypothetical protein IscW_ISCW014290 [Ixodes scapularis]